jgi:hypothetical protein
MNSDLYIRGLVSLIKNADVVEAADILRNALGDAAQVPGTSFDAMNAWNPPTDETAVTLYTLMSRHLHDIRVSWIGRGPAKYDVMNAFPIVVQNHISNSAKINAIKELRNACIDKSGNILLGLKDAKDLVEYVMND